MAELKTLNIEVRVNAAIVETVQQLVDAMSEAVHLIDLGLDPEDTMPCNSRLRLIRAQLTGDSLPPSPRDEARQELNDIRQDIAALLATGDMYLDAAAVRRVVEP